MLIKDIVGLCAHNVTMDFSHFIVLQEFYSRDVCVHVLGPEENYVYLLAITEMSLYCLMQVISQGLSSKSRGHD